MSPGAASSAIGFRQRHASSFVGQPWSLRGSAIKTSTSLGNITIAPADWDVAPSTGDLVVAIREWDYDPKFSGPPDPTSTHGTFTARLPTLGGSGFAFDLYTETATSGDSYTQAAPGSPTADGFLFVCAFVGSKTFDKQASQSNGSSTTGTMPSVSSAANGEFPLWILLSGNSTASVPAGTALVRSAVSTSIPRRLSVWKESLTVAAGATGTRTSTLGAASTSTGAGALFQ